MNPFKKAMNDEWAGIRVSPEMRERVMTVKHLKKRISSAAALACALALIAAGALAVTVGGIVRQKMEPVEEMHESTALGNWGLETKLALIARMREWGLEMDGQLLATAEDPAMETAAREQAADGIIFAVFTKDEMAELQAAQPDVEQPEPYPVPSDYTIYRTLWLKESPGSDEAEIRAAFEEWEAETAARVNARYEPAEYASYEEEALALFADEMSEILSMSKEERAAATVSAGPAEGTPLWLVTMTVPGKALRPSTKDTLRARSILSPETYDASADTYTRVTLYEAAEGGLRRVPDAHSVAEYEYAKLKETLAWPGSAEDVHGNYHRFLTAPVSEKAAFSAAARPAALAWYATHADFYALLEKGFREGTVLDELYMVTRHIYGVPAGNAPGEEEIRKLAAEKYAGLPGHASAETVLGGGFNLFVWYDVTDAESPVWKVTVRSDSDADPAGWMKHETRHMVFSADGTLLRDGGEPLMTNGIETPPEPPLSAPLNEEDRVEF